MQRPTTPSRSRTLAALAVVLFTLTTLAHPTAAQVDIDTALSDPEVAEDDVSRETSIVLTMEPFQLTPGGRIPGAADSRLVRTARAISRHLGYEPSMSESGSSNLNVAIGAGTPAIGLGGSRGGERGQPGEWADVDAMMRTAEHVLLLAVMMGG